MVTRLSTSNTIAHALAFVILLAPGTVFAKSFCRAVARSESGGVVTVTTGTFDDMFKNLERNVKSSDVKDVLNQIRQPQIIWSLPFGQPHVEVDLAYVGPRIPAFNRVSGGHVTINMPDLNCRTLDLRVDVRRETNWMPVLGRKECGVASTRSDFIFDDPSGLHDIIKGHSVRIILHPPVGSDREIMIAASETSARDALLAEDWAQIDKRQPAVCPPH